MQTVTGKLFRIDPATGEAKAVDLGGYVLTNGDGLLLEHGKLSVVQNRLNKIAQFEMSRDLLSGRLVRTLTDPDFDVPTTITRAKGTPLRGERAVRHAADAGDDRTRWCGSASEED